MRVEISPGMRNLWRVIQTIRDAGAHDAWEPAGRKREYLSARGQLQSLLGLDKIDPAAFNPDDAADPEPPAWMQHPLELANYRRAHQIYRLLQQAIAVEDERARVGV